MLVQGMARDLIERGGIRAVEAFGDTRGRRHGRCVVPVDFLGSVGFKTQRAHRHDPRMRMELRSALTWKDEVEARWSACWGRCDPLPEAARQVPGPKATPGPRHRRRRRAPGAVAVASGDELGELVEQRRLGPGADDRLHDLAAVVDVDRRDAGDPVRRRVTGFSSTFILRNVILSPCAVAISSRIGATWRHGPHHSAQKSTRTGLSDLRTCDLELGVGHGSDVRHGYSLSGRCCLCSVNTRPGTVVPPGPARGAAGSEAGGLHGLGDGLGGDRGPGRPRPSRPRGRGWRGSARRRGPPRSRCRPR